MKSVAATQAQETTAPVSMAKSYYVLILLTLVWAFQFANSMLEASAFAGTLTAIAGIAGVLAGGAVIGYLGKRDDRWKIVGPGLTSLLAGPALIAFLFVPMPWTYAALFFAMIFMVFRMGPVLGLVGLGELHLSSRDFIRG